MWTAECFWPGDETPSLRLESEDRRPVEDACRDWLSRQYNNGCMAVVCRDGALACRLGFDVDKIIRPDLFRVGY